MTLTSDKPPLVGKPVAPSEKEDDYDFEDFENEDEVGSTHYQNTTNKFAHALN